MKNTTYSIAMFLVFWSMTSQAYEGRVDRFALVIGNKNYATAPLRNTINDARAIGTILEKLGFEVTTVFDTLSVDIQKTITSFYSGLPSGNELKSLALFYYAGHAVQINHRNYLVPLDIELGNPEEFMARLFDINDLFAQIPNSIRIQNVIILDACRNNPFDSGSGENGSPLIMDGLAPLRAPSGTLIAYATEPGSVASDGSGKHGVYTKHLLKHIKKKVSVEEIFKKVRRGVAKETGNSQIPWEHSSLLEAVFINPPRNRDIPDLIAF